MKHDSTHILNLFKQLLLQEKASPEDIQIIEESSKIPDRIVIHPIKPIKKSSSSFRK